MSDITEVASRLIADLDTKDEEDAFHRLIELGGGVAPALTSAFSYEQRPTVRALLVRVIGEFRDSASVRFLEFAFDDPSPEVWKASLDALVNLGGTVARDALFRLREKEVAGSMQGARLDWVNEALEQTKNRE